MRTRNKKKKKKFLFRYKKDTGRQKYAGSGNTFYNVNDKQFSYLI